MPEAQALVLGAPSQDERVNLRLVSGMDTVHRPSAVGPKSEEQRSGDRRWVGAGHKAAARLDYLHPRPSPPQYLTHRREVAAYKVPPALDYNHNYEHLAIAAAIRLRRQRT